VPKACAGNSNLAREVRSPVLANDLPIALPDLLYQRDC
jgi:hypothetical protein